MLHCNTGMQPAVYLAKENYFKLSVIRCARGHVRHSDQKGPAHRLYGFSKAMTDTMRGVVRAFCDALGARAPELFSNVLDDNVEWTVFGPIDLFPFFGQRRGKKAVMAMFGEMSANLSLIRAEKETLLVDGDNAAALVRLNAIDTRTGRTLSLRLALFARFSGGKLVSLKALFDTFDAVEQALGRHIDLSHVA